MADNKQLKKDKISCIVAIGLMLASYVCERVLEVLIDITPKCATVMILVFTVLLIAACYIVSNTKNIFFGMLAALVGYKMMPPSIPALIGASSDANIFYFVVQKIAVIAFIWFAVKLYREQKDPVPIKALPILACMVVMPFFNEIAEVSGAYMMSHISGTMLYLYFARFACYIIATAVILAFAYQTNYETMRFVAYFEYVALGVNIIRRCGYIASCIIYDTHISKSIFVWIAIYVVCIVCFAVAKKSKKASEI